jgi:hypothetical protein
VGHGMDHAGLPNTTVAANVGLTPSSPRPGLQTGSKDVVVVGYVRGDGDIEGVARRQRPLHPPLHASKATT